MRSSRPVLANMFALVFVFVLALAAAEPDHSLTEFEFHGMPALFSLDGYRPCVARRHLYCLGSFELAPAPHRPAAAALYRDMQRYSSNWADHFNHTRLHRGVCVSRRCPSPPAPPALDPAAQHRLHVDWFESCVNASTMAEYGLSARALEVEYCQAGPPAPSPPSPAARALLVTVAALGGLAVLGTALDLTLPAPRRKGRWFRVVSSWSVPACWAALGGGARAEPAGPGGSDLRAFDGLRVLCLMCVIVEHVAWLSTQAYLANPREVELTRRAADATMMANSTLVVQIFFMMSSFLLAHKVLEARRRRRPVPALPTFGRTLLHRLVRVSPSYWAVVWWAATWWERGGGGAGPLWPALVAAEAAVCRRKWWTHLLYLNNVLAADDKCLIQTWYLAADMQLYVVGLALTLVLLRWRRGALLVLSALLVASVALLAALAARWRLLPTFLMHNPESVRSVYRDGRSFNVLYQSPLGNAPGALAGLLLAHAHHHLLHRGVRLADYKVFGWVSALCVPLAAWWVAASPRLAPGGAGVDGAGGAEAALAALERPVFAALVGLALIGAIHGVPSATCRVLSWRGWAVWARLSFGALLLHMPLNKALVAGRAHLTQLDRQHVIVEWFGVAGASFLLAVPLALLVELPAQRLLHALTAGPAPPHHQAPPPHSKTGL